VVLRVGIAGFGVVGRRRKQCVDNRTDLDVVAVCDQSFDTSGVLDDGTRFHPTLTGVFSEDLDVLIVCLPNDIAPEVTVEGLEAGLHVFCEKPPGRTPADVQRVIESQRERPELKVMYGFNHRYHDSVQDALSIVRSGRLGAVISMRGTYGKAKLITFNQPDWRTRRDVAGGGVLLDQGIHMVDLIRLFGGECHEVHSYISNSHWGYDVEDNAYALMRSVTGVVSLLNSSATQWRHRFHLDINLERGSLVLGGLVTGTKSYGAETLTVVEADPDNDYGDPREQTTRYNRDSSWEREINVFAECIANDLAIEEGSSLEALRTMQLVYRIYFADPTWRERYDIPDPDSGRENR
jgi:predicted dehydrogenase